MKTLIVVLLTIGLCFVLKLAYAQTGDGKIEGKVIDAGKKPADGATVNLLNAQSLVVIKTILTNPDGTFKFGDLQNGSYQVTVSSMGYQNYKSDSLVIGKQVTVTLPAITLIATSKQLKQVDIAAQKAFVEQKIDRTVVNVNALISNTGSNALEALEKTPGVLVDDNGNISFKGKAGVMVLIDDKPTYLSGQDLANYLKSIPASQLDVIELMANPPAKYDASGNAGVINIKIKKSKAKGFNGNIAASVGRAAYWRTLESINLNYHVNKINLFTNIGYGIQNGYRRLDVSRTYFDAAGNRTSAYNETAFFNPKNHNGNIKLGLDYYASPKTTFGVVLTGALTTGNNYNPVNSFLSNAAGNVDSNIVSVNNTQSKFRNAGINLNYLHQFDRKDQSLSFDFDHLNYNSHRDQSFISDSYNNTGNLEGTQYITDNLPTDINIYAAKTDYIQPVGTKGRFETGLKTSYVNTDNAANYFNVVKNISTINNNTTNRFLYKENINAAYVSFNTEFKRIAMQTGLRTENTNINGHQLGNAQSPDSSFTQHYTSVFPTAYVLYKLDTAGSNSLKLSYGRRIDRPYYQDLNPFVTILDKYSTWEGNPFLKPQFIDAYQFTYSFKSVFSFTVDYNVTKDYQIEYDGQKGDIFYATTINLGRKAHWGFEGNLSFNPFKWWNFNLYTELDCTSFEGQLTAHTNIDLNDTHWYFSNNNQFSFSNGWSAEISSFYVSPARDGQFTPHSREQTNIGIQKKILNNKASVKLTARDIFRTNFSGGNITNIPNVVATYHNDNANRSVTLGFTYNFGSSKDNPKKRDTNSATDEAKRVGN
ncbi:outer membrane beta-barrel protein [Mucilaginibacter sp. AW1-3]